MRSVNYHRCGHFARDCNGKLRENQSDEAKVARQEVDDDNTVLVMITEENYGSNQLLDSSCNIRDGVQGSDEWYLDYGFPTHMTCRKDLFVEINQATKNKVKVADDTTLVADGVNDVLIMRRDGGPSLIKDVIYILGIKCNLLSIGQLLEKDYIIRMENKILRILDRNKVLVLKAPMTSDRTFKIEFGSDGA
ncbi:uncharacterized protein LOC131629192 [Vicia villosa]|uniref:uncharacterized protein LOC131629192 n=1 Tax=Vicia villosa TaxID=3911 RepID=UPI00273B10AC|nr:uncharacterized protein LOC131629192 [Vicia villosa]